MRVREEHVAGRPLEIEWLSAESRVRERLHRFLRVNRVIEFDQRADAIFCKTTEEGRSR